jgi:hypothetical protein
LPAYRLLTIEDDFVQSTRQAMEFTGKILIDASARITELAKDLELTFPDHDPDVNTYIEDLPPGRLPQDRTRRNVESVSKTVTLLATAFLNLAAESHLLDNSARAKQNAICIDDNIAEENLRGLQLRFHNLQSLYDTYVSETETEVVDPDLPVLRGHISVVFHLLRIATSFSHYYERHVCGQTGQSSQGKDPLVDSKKLSSMLTGYSINFSTQYLECAQRLCQKMLKRYAEIARIEVPVPQYRGFHVRPSTLVAKLVLHYGSNVIMELSGEAYDASKPLELFRANEKINARKRRWLVDEILRLRLVPKDTSNMEVKEVIRGVVLTLAEKSRLVIFEQPLQLSEEAGQKQGTLLERVLDEIALLQATGKIDIDTDIKISFTGDKRVLLDIETLANAGYGEDNFGNNIALPETLVYLRR